jgi:hypothetical protein
VEFATAGLPLGSLKFSWGLDVKTLMHDTWVFKERRLSLALESRGRSGKSQRFRWLVSQSLDCGLIFKGMAKDFRAFASISDEG